MFNLLWSFLNLVLVLSLAYVFFRAANLLKQRIGWGTALFFTVGVALVSGSKVGIPLAPAAPSLLTETPTGAPVGNGSTLQHITLGTNKLMLLAEYYDKQGVVTPRGLYAVVSETTLGHRWQPVAGSLTPRGRQFDYTAVVDHEWYLLDTKVFSQMQRFNGLMPLGALPQ